MTWRRFTVLYRNLSPFGAVASRIESIRSSPAQDEDITEEEGRSQAAAFFSSVLASGGPGGNR